MDILVPGERRHCRFPVSLPLRYSLKSAGGGIGELFYISSGGVRFYSDRFLRAGQNIDVSLPWPLRLDGHCGLRLWLRGHTLRSDATVTAIAIQRYEFRTASQRVAEHRTRLTVV